MTILSIRVIMINEHSCESAQFLSATAGSGGGKHPTASCPLLGRGTPHGVERCSQDREGHIRVTALHPHLFVQSDSLHAFIDYKKTNGKGVCAGHSSQTRLRKGNRI